MISPRFFAPLESSLECTLCPRRCVLSPDTMGRCKVRFNRGGKADIPFYGYITAFAVDPIEKKPLYHFRPGTEILSAGFAGCNLNCPFCQNWHISQNTDVPGKLYTPAKLIAAAKSSIAYTYSEPLIHIEFLLDCMKEAREAGIANVLVSNGCINKEAAEEILELCDAANIDLKCFSEKTYREVLGGDLSAVTGLIHTALEKNVRLEITTLLVPGLNDSRVELDKCRDFIAELQTEKSASETGNAVPWHISAYHPNYKCNEQASSPHSIISAVKRAREKLEFVYAGNVAPPPEEQGFNDTLCPLCGKTLISRRGYRVDMSGCSLKKEKVSTAYFCASCGKKAPFSAVSKLPLFVYG